MAAGGPIIVADVEQIIVSNDARVAQNVRGDFSRDRHQQPIATVLLMQRGAVLLHRWPNYFPLLYAIVHFCYSCAGAPPGTFERPTARFRFLLLDYSAASIAAAMSTT
jgi:hypothetical protein